MAIEKKSLVDQIYETLRKEIVRLERKPGVKLNVAEIQQQLGVSCTPVREAVNRLQQEGLVIYQNNIGAHIISLDSHDLDEIQQLGDTLHCAAINYAMQNPANDGLIENLEKYYDIYRNSTEEQEEILALHYFIGSFYWFCGNKRLDNCMSALRAQQLIVRNMAIKVSKKRAEEAAYLEKMLQYTKEGKTEEICRVMTEYSEIITEKARVYLKRNKK